MAVSWLMGKDQDSGVFCPYKILGVQPDADDTAIRLAFRKKVRSSHPDSGGSTEEFQTLKRAYDLLSDKESRRLFDETGEWVDVPLDPRQTKIIEILSIGLDKTLFKIATEPQKFQFPKIIDLIATEIEEQRKELNIQKANYEQALAVSQDLLERFSVSEGKNLMRSVISKRISICEFQIAHIAEQMTRIDEALDYLKKTEFQIPLAIEFSKNQTSARPSADTKRVFKGYHPLLDWGELIKF